LLLLLLLLQFPINKWKCNMGKCIWDLTQTDLAHEVEVDAAEGDIVIVLVLQ
jgi:hypothetical protein